MKTGCGKPTHVSGTNGGTMPCGGSLTWLDGSTTQEFCAKCSHFKFRIDSSKPGSYLRPQTFCMTEQEAHLIAEQHAHELPGCVTTITSL